jgi:NADH-quinone oxidoreductase subunit M
MGFLSAFVFSPLIGFLFLFLIPKKDKKIVHVAAIVCSIIPFLLSLVLLAKYNQGNLPKDFVEWLQFEIGGKVLTIDYELAIDGLSLVFLLLTTFVTLLAMIASSWQIKQNSRLFYQFMFLLELGILGVFASDNLLFFFIFFEITLVPMFFLISKWGATDREEAAFSYIIYNGLGSMVLLIGIVTLFVVTGSTNFSEIQSFFAANSNRSVQIGVTVAFLIAFGIKLPIFPVHYWMVRVHVHAPPAVVMIHAGILLKIGAYGLIKFGVGFFPEVFKDIALILGILGLINLLYGAYVALVQEDLRSVFAYSSISHMGIILIGIAALNTAGIQGAIFQAVSHGLIAAMLFFLVGTLESRTKTTLFKKLSGLSRLMPVLAGLFLAAGLASLGLPGMSGFISEFTVFLGIFREMPVIGAIGILGLILTVVYILRAILHMNYGSYKNTFGNVQDIKVYELVPALLLLLCIIGIGVYPNILVQFLELAIETILPGIGG